MTKARSIHIGLNKVDPAHYQGWDGALRACEADAQDMDAIAAASGFDERVMLLTQEATADRVTAEIASAARDIGSDGVLFLTYSGHGGHLPDATEGGDEDDDRDETWLLYDRELLDDELYAAWSQFEPGARIFVLSDSCHSGTATRGADRAEAVERAIADYAAADSDARARTIPPVLGRAVFSAHRDLYGDLQKAHPGGDHADVEAQVILISGCQDDQVSLDGPRNGAFTARLREVWNDGAFAGDHRRLHQEIVALMPDSQTPNYFTTGRVAPEFEAQRPLTVEVTAQAH